MMLYLAFFMLAAIFLVLALVQKSNVHLEYFLENRRDKLVLSVYTLDGLIWQKFVLSKLEWSTVGIRLEWSIFGIKSAKKLKKEDLEKEAEEEKKKLGFDELVERYDQLMQFKASKGKIVKYLKGKFLLNDFRLEAVIGTENAFLTAMASGMAWALTGAFTSYLNSTKINMLRCVNIKNNFNEKELKVDLFCIFRIKNVHIIVVILMYLADEWGKKLKEKFKLGGDKHGEPSDRRSDDHSNGKHKGYGGRQHNCG